MILPVHLPYVPGKQVVHEYFILKYLRVLASHVVSQHHRIDLSRTDDDVDGVPPEQGRGSSPPSSPRAVPAAAPIGAASSSTRAATRWATVRNRVQNTSEFLTDAATWREMKLAQEEAQVREQGIAIGAETEVGAAKKRGSGWNRIRAAVAAGELDAFLGPAPGRAAVAEEEGPLVSAEDEEEEVLREEGQDWRRDLVEQEVILEEGLGGRTDRIGFHMGDDVDDYELALGLDREEEEELTLAQVMINASTFHQTLKRRLKDVSERAAQQSERRGTIVPFPGNSSRFGGGKNWSDDVLGPGFDSDSGDFGLDASKFRVARAAEGILAALSSSQITSKQNSGIAGEYRSGPCGAVPPPGGPSVWRMSPPNSKSTISGAVEDLPFQEKVHGQAQLVEAQLLLKKREEAGLCEQTRREGTRESRRKKGRGDSSLLRTAASGVVSAGETTAGCVQASAPLAAACASAAVGLGLVVGRLCGEGLLSAAGIELRRPVAAEQEWAQNNVGGSGGGRGQQAQEEIVSSAVNVVVDCGNVVVGGNVVVDSGGRAAPGSRVAIRDFSQPGIALTRYYEV